MKFTKLHDGISCDCLEGSFTENAAKFAIKTNKNTLRDADFKTYWEKGKRLTNDCNDICSLKGQSVNLASNDEELHDTLQIFKALFPIAPGYKPHCAVISFEENSGVIKSTPLPNNALHHDFYKSDDFTLDMIKFYQTFPLENV